MIQTLKEENYIVDELGNSLFYKPINDNSYSVTVRYANNKPSNPKKLDLFNKKNPIKDISDFFKTIDNKTLKCFPSKQYIPDDIVETINSENFSFSHDQQANIVYTKEDIDQVTFLYFIEMNELDNHGNIIQNSQTRRLQWNISIDRSGKVTPYSCGSKAGLWEAEHEGITKKCIDLEQGIKFLKDSTTVSKEEYNI